MFQPCHFRHKINKNKAQNKRKKTKTVKRREFRLFLLYIKKPIKTCATERTYKLWRERNKTEREYIDANKLLNVRTDVLYKKRQWKRKLTKLKKSKQSYRLLRITLKREKSREKNKIKIESDDKKILLGFDSDGKAVVLKYCQGVVEELFKEEEAIKKVDKDPIDDHFGDEEGFEQELWNERSKALSKEY